MHTRMHHTRMRECDGHSVDSATTDQFAPVQTSFHSVSKSRLRSVQHSQFSHLCVATRTMRVFCVLKACRVPNKHYVARDNSPSAAITQSETLLLQPLPEEDRPPPLHVSASKVSNWQWRYCSQSTYNYMLSCKWDVALNGRHYWVIELFSHH